MKKIAVALLILVSFVLTAGQVFAYRNPGIPTGFVNDYAGLLTVEQRTALESKLVEFKNNTGSEIAVVTIAGLEGDTIENFAVKLFEDWKIGEAGKDNGALLLIARDDREVRIEVGYGLEPVLTDALSSRIIRNVITPAFRKNDFAGGIAGAADAMMMTISGDESAILQDESAPEYMSYIPLFWIAVPLLIWLASIFARSKSWWAGGVVGAVLGVVISFFFNFIFIGLVAIVVLVPLGLLLDFLVSRGYKKSKSLGVNPAWWTGGRGFGGGSGSSGGGFGGFGGGRSGGGGASGGW